MATQSRQKPGSSGEGDYYHVEVLPKTGFVTFRTQDVGEHGHIQRVAGKRPGGSWATVKWLIGKEDAHVEGDRLIPDTKGAKDVIKQIGAQPVHLKGDIFKAKASASSSSTNAGKRSQPKSKPTVAQQRARRENIKKAQAARRTRS
jgi:hypothetical protein